MDSFGKICFPTSNWAIMPSCFVKVEDTAHHNTVNKYFKKSHPGSKDFNDQAAESELEITEANLVGSSHRGLFKFSILYFRGLHYIHKFDKSILNRKNLLLSNKMLQNHWLSLELIHKKQQKYNLQIYLFTSNYFL